MAVTYGFYNSINNDRRYNAEQISSLFDGLIRDGVFASIGGELMVSASSGMNVIVAPGRAWFNHTWTYNDTELPLTVEQAEVILNRIDAVVLEVNATQEVRANSIKIIKGIPGSMPSPPELISSELVNQYPLAYIYVGAGVTEITQSNITNKVGTSDCPFVIGVLQAINIDDLLAQWDSEFNDWFTMLQTTLDQNVVTNIMNLINQTSQALSTHESKDGSTSQKGHVQLSTSTSSTSTTLAATPSAVKAAYDLANAAIPKSLATAANDFLVASGSGAWVKKTQAEAKAIINTANDIVAVSASKTLALSDGGKIQDCTNSSNITITIPPNSSVAFPIGTEIAIIRIGAGDVSIAPGSGVTLNSDGGKRKIKGQYMSCALKKIATDTWVLVGALTA